jgi:hypothetical protein
MKLILVSIIFLNVFFAQYTIGQGIYGGGGLQYNYSLLFETLNANNSTTKITSTFKSQKINFSFDLVYCFNRNNYIDFGFARQNFNFSHNSYLLTNVTNGPNIDDTFDFNDIRVEYLSGFNETPFFISSGINILAPIKESIPNNYNLLDVYGGIMGLGLKYEYGPVIYTFKTSYSFPFTKLKGNEINFLYLSNLALNFKIWIKLL